MVNDLLTAGGKIHCPRCQAHSKRTKLQCGSPAEKGKKVCRFHGARSSGAKTEAGRQRIAQAKTRHGDETRQARAERSAMSAKILAMEDILYLINAATGPRTRGRKPAIYTPITALEAAFEYMAAHPITSG
jgi:predicted amidophosphoribosyltransferase